MAQKRGLASRLRDRIRIRRNARVSDGKGGFSGDWGDLAHDGTLTDTPTWRYAEVVSQNGREAVLAGALQGVSAYRITIRRDANVQAGDQILYRPPFAAADETLNIKSVAPHHEIPREATVILADTEAAQRAG
jgi:head-tail adaptor